MRPRLPQFGIFGSQNRHGDVTKAVLAPLRVHEQWSRFERKPTVRSMGQRMNVPELAMCF